MPFRDPRGFTRRSVPGRVSETASLFGEEGRAEKGMTVSAYVAQLNNALRFQVPEAWVRGEVGEWRPWSSGHVYFTLKDEGACLNGMMWADDVARVPFRVDPGMVVLARGRSNVYPRSGKLSFVATEVQPYGAGALQLAFEQRKARLAAEGLFDLARKRPLPALPRCIGVVSSRRGAAVRDVLKVLRARFPNAHVTLFPVAVQGPYAAAEIVRALDAFSRTAKVDVVIVARGGGSAEDLAAFNDERVVRAVARSSVPTIAAVGHEVDVTLTDLVADVRAATPSQAAELVVKRREELVSELEGCRRHLTGALRRALHEARAELADLAGAEGLGGFPSRVTRRRLESDAARAALFSAVRALPAAYGETLARAEQGIASWPARAALPHLLRDVESRRRALADVLATRLGSAKERLGGASGRLSALDPLAILARGYSVAYANGSTTPLTDAAKVSAGDAVRLLLAKGEVDAKVTATRPDGGLSRPRLEPEPEETA